MQLVWKPAAARGLGPAVVAQKEEGEAARFCLMPQKQDIYLLQDVRFARQLLPQERDALWQDFCALMQQRGARLHNSPQHIARDGHALWLTTSALLSLELDTMQEQFERQYLDVLDSQDESEIDLAKYNLQWLSETRAAREAMTEDDVYISLTHVPP